MLRFNKSVLVRIKQPLKISIHPMLRFNENKISGIPLPNLFQYILCYGSTFISFFFKFVLEGFQYILCYGSTIAVHMIYAFHYTGITLKHQQFL